MSSVFIVWCALWPPLTISQFSHFYFIRTYARINLRPETTHPSMSVKRECLRGRVHSIASVWPFSPLIARRMIVSEISCPFFFLFFFYSFFISLLYGKLAAVLLPTHLTIQVHPVSRIQKCDLPYSHRHTHLIKSSILLLFAIDMDVWQAFSNDWRWLAGL